ncbi:MAG TPA: Uma2 family endonuclease [Roseiflexaceae bacterium]|nr:Uma2 family endonuclease [Roseiflexaceae bacterium]HMP41920.1 Uma2 family endonuclease [Roseiflexaceae bacterium]
MSQQQLQHCSAAEYLAFERSHPERHAFIDGRIVLQAGGSRTHALISANTVSTLHRQLSDRECSVYGSDMRIAIPQRNQYLYPDVSVACEPARFTDDYEDSLTTPTMIIEVLSPSTERYDRGKKFQAYQAIETFQEYLLIAQDALLVEHFVRHADNLWSFDAHSDHSAVITLRSIGCALALADVYAKVAFAEADDDTAPE